MNQQQQQPKADPDDIGFVIPQPLMEKIANYLSRQPYADVAPLLAPFVSGGLKSVQISSLRAPGEQPSQASAMHLLDREEPNPDTANPDTANGKNLIAAKG